MKLHYHVCVDKTSNLAQHLEGLQLEGSLELSLEEMTAVFQQLKDVPQLVENIFDVAYKSMPKFVAAKKQLREANHAERKDSWHAHQSMMREEKRNKRTFRV